MKRLIYLVVICAVLPTSLFSCHGKKSTLGPLTMESLSDEDRQIVKQHYEELLSAHEKRDYAQMLAHTNVILAYVKDYNDTRAYDTIARRGIASSEKSPGAGE